MSEETTIKCVRCPAEFVAGEVASSMPVAREDIIAAIIQQLGWEQTFAGWQCPRHG